MTETAQLLIKPTLVGSLRSQVGGLSRQVTGMHREQLRLINAGRRGVLALGRAYDVATRGVRGLGRALSIVQRSVLNVRTAVAGLGVLTLGRSIFELTIGRADDIRRSRASLLLVFNDVQKVQRVMERSRALANLIPSLTFGEAVAGFEQLAVLGAGNVERTEQLVRLAKALESTAPEQGFEGAAFALRELSTGDTMSLRSRFGFMVPTRSEAERMARQAGQTLQEFYVDRVTQELFRRYPGASSLEDIFSIDANTVRGQLAQFKTAFLDAMAEVGAAANELLADRLPGMLEDLRGYLDSDSFRQDAEALGQTLSMVVGKLLEVARALPQTLADLGEWWERNQGWARPLAIAGGVNFLTGGGAGQLAGGALRLGGAAVRGITSRLMPRAASGSLPAIAGVPPGVTPVWVVGGVGGLGEGAPGVPGFFGRNLGGGAALSVGSRFGLGALGGLGSVAFAAILTTAVGVGVADALGSVLSMNEARREARERRERLGTPEEQRQRERERLERVEELRQRSERGLPMGEQQTLAIRRRLSRLTLSRNPAVARRALNTITQILGGPGNRIDDDQERATLELIQEWANQHEQDFVLDERGRVSSGRLVPRERERGVSAAQELLRMTPGSATFDKDLWSGLQSRAVTRMVGNIPVTQASGEGAGIGLNMPGLSGRRIAIPASEALGSLEAERRRELSAEVQRVQRLEQVAHIYNSIERSAIEFAKGGGLLDALTGGAVSGRKVPVGPIIEKLELHVSGSQEAGEEVVRALEGALRQWSLRTGG